MTEEEEKEIASQLRKPSGELGKEVANRLAKSNATIYRHTIKTLAPTKGDRILEIGMGRGSHIAEIIDVAENIIYTGCDYSGLMVEEAMKENQDLINAGAVEILNADVTNLPFPSLSFTKVFTVNTIYFWDDVTKGLNELKRVLKPTGKLYIAGRPKHIMKDYPFSAHGFRMFDKEDLKLLLKQHGFQITGVIEEKEEPREMDGKIYKIETLIVSGSKL